MHDRARPGGGPAGGHRAGDRPPAAAAAGNTDRGATASTARRAGRAPAMREEKGHTMATDYDAPRRNEADELGEDSLEEL